MSTNYSEKAASANANLKKAMEITAHWNDDAAIKYVGKAEDTMLDAEFDAHYHSAEGRAYRATKAKK